MASVLKRSSGIFRLFFSVFLLAAGCGKDVDDVLPQPENVIKVTLQRQEPGPSISDNFLGFSYEKGDITDPAFFSPSKTTLFQLWKNLGPGVLRIGARSVDQT